MSEPHQPSNALPPGMEPPHHVAVIMDGNGRWARARGQARHYGHRAGVNAVRDAVEVCGEAGVQALTLFAFSSENWRRPPAEVRMLMELFLRTLERETERLRENNVRLRLIGDRRRFTGRLQQLMARAEAVTAASDGMTLSVAASYGGRWDIAETARRLAVEVARGERSPESIDEALFAARISLGDLPEPDLFIRTGGERRISNFLLWQLAYSELYFSDVLWPDFRAEAMREALLWFAGRERRFGMTAEQLERQHRA